uniref:Proteasome subunit beta type 1 n=1 Tax=Arundo donax TaxID=35708 RepID=A0A0A9FR77_ARUDO
MTTISNLSPVYMSRSVADAKTSFTRSTASDSDKGVTASRAGSSRGLGDFNWLSRTGIINVAPVPCAL